MSRADRSIVVRHVSKTFTLRYHRTLKQMSVAMARQQELSDSFGITETRSDGKTVWFVVSLEERSGAQSR